MGFVSRCRSLLISPLFAVVWPIAVAAAPIGSEFQVNSYTIDDQADRGLAVSAAEGGDFVVTWNSTVVMPVASYNDVAARRFSSAGTALGADFAVNTFTADEQGRRALEVASSATGGFVVVWSSFLQDGYDYGVFGRRYSSDGTALGTEFQVNTYTTFGQGKQPLGLASDGAGNFVVAWGSAEQDGDGSGVFAQRFDSAGGRVGTEFQIPASAAGEQGSNQVALGGDRLGNFTVAWDAPDGSGYGVFARRFSSAGTALGTETQVNSIVAGDQGVGGLAVASDGRGNFVVAWNGQTDGGLSGVFARKYLSDGTALGGEFQVNTYTTGDQGLLGLAAASDPAGNFVIAWTETGGRDGYGNGVFAQQFAASGNRIGTEFQVNTYTTGDQGYRGLAAAAGGLGDFVITWGSDYDQDGDKNGAFAQLYAGNLCGSEPNPTCNSATTPKKAKVAVRDSADDSADQFFWKWSGGGATTFPEFGDPSATTTYKLCVYDTTAGAPSLVMQIAVPPGGTCAGKPCWKALKTKGWKYKDKAGANGGITKIKLKAGAAGKSKVLVKAKGAAIPLPAPISGTEFFDQDTTVRVQLFSSAGACWDSTFTAPASSNSSDQFKDKNE